MFYSGIFLFVCSTTLGTFIKFLNLLSKVECQNVSTTNCKLHIGWFCVSSLEMYINLSLLIPVILYTILFFYNIKRKIFSAEIFAERFGRAVIEGIWHLETKNHRPPHFGIIFSFLNVNKKIGRKNFVLEPFSIDQVKVFISNPIL